MADIVWTIAYPDLTGAERCRLDERDGGWRLTGVVAARYDGAPIDAHYEVAVTDGWLTRSVAVTVDQATTQPRTLHLDRSPDGTWSVDGTAAPHLDGCTDVDLGITPATNTLPIRRLDLAVGTEETIDVAWVRFPDLRVERGSQAYARVADHVWRYRSGSFEADLAVDADGLVVRYGDDLWRQVPA